MCNNLPKKINIFDVALRDGLQHEEKFIPTEAKLWIANALINAGFKHLEVGSFSHIKYAPQFKDILQVLKGLPNRKDVEYTVLALNMKACERVAEAVDVGLKIDRVLCGQFATSEAYARKNMNNTHEELFAEAKKQVKFLKEVGIKKIVGNVGTIFGCPVQGKVPIEKAYEFTDRCLSDIGFDEVSHSDTEGIATPNEVYKYFLNILEKYPDPNAHSLHIHDVRGMGALQIGQGIQYSFGIESTTSLLTAIIAIMSVFYIVAAVSKVDGLMKRIGNANMIMYVFLLLFVFFFGPMRFIVENIITSFGQYIQNLPMEMTNFDPYMQDSWVESWTSFFLPWWLAACPPTGLFLVKLSKGRTLRQFVMVNLIFPSLFCILWTGVFGSAGIYYDLYTGTGIGQAIVNFGKEAATYELLKTMPLPSLTIMVTLICAAVSFNTKATAVSYTLAGMTMKSNDPDTEPPKPMIAFWGIIMAAFTIILLYTGGKSALSAIQTASVICGLPNAVLLIFMGLGFIKSMLYCKEYDKVGTFSDKSTNVFHQ